MTQQALYVPETTAVVDIETNLAHSKLWMAGVCKLVDGEPSATICYTAEQLEQELDGITTVVGHNLIKFDLPVLSRLWGWKTSRTVVDTYVLGRLLNPVIEGGHSLKAWAERAGGELKDEFDAYDDGISDDMIAYCKQDAKANWDVVEYMEEWRVRDKVDTKALWLEQLVQYRTKVQEDNGFAFNFEKGCSLYAAFTQRMREIEEELQQVFPPIVTERWSEKTGKRLKDKVEVFNVGSRPQIAKRLASKGAVWRKKTEKGNVVVDEQTLAANKHIPEAALVLEYLTLTKKAGMVRGWIDAYQEDGRIYGSVNTMGAVTFRMTHSKPNLAQVDKDKDMRACYKAAEGCKLVGIDASGLELRMLAHYMDDEEYTELILHGDIHTYNQEAAGLPTRDLAKTFIYAFLYGAGDAKIGTIAGGGAAKGKKLKANFLRSLPALDNLITRVKRIAGRKGSLPGLDGRRVPVRSEHAALNTLLQSAGAIVMKQALVLATERLDELGYPYKLVAQVHDEFQVEVPEEYAKRVGVVFRNAIREAGRVLELRCPLDGEYKIGNNWSETH